MMRKWLIVSGCVAVALALVAAALPRQVMAGGLEQWVSWVYASGEPQERESRVIRFGSPMGAGGYLGVRLEEVTAENRAGLGLSKEEGALVQEVEKESPAEVAGILNGDVIVAYAGYPVFSAVQLARFVSDTPVGREVSVDVMRSGRKVTVTAKIGKRSGEGLRVVTPRLEMERLPELHDRDWSGMMPHIEIDRDRNLLRVEAGGRRLGVSVIELTDQLAEKYGVTGKKGVLVTSVEKDTPAFKAGLQAGDVITDVAGRSVSEAGDVSNALRRADTDDIELKISRDGKAMTLTAKFEPRSGTKTRVIL